MDTDRHTDQEKDMTYEVQFMDGQGAWRRWSHLSNRATAESSANRCREFLGTSAAVRIRERSA